jgi:beta-lactamase regulating signal transducer with metallopeptidase domain/uncharacterized protein involved in exopolysaccharide biosynthesis
VNAIWGMIHHPLAGRVGWILLHSLWQGALIGVGFALVRFALRKQSAQARYLAGCVCLTLALAAPLLTLFLSPVPMHEQSVAYPELFHSGPAASAQEIVVAPTASGENWLLWGIQSAAIFLSQLAPWMTIAWLAGVAFSSCKLLRGFWWVQTIRRKEADSVSADLLKRLDDLRRRLAISRPVRLLKSALVEVPTVVGWLRPVILLPAASLAGLTPGQLEAILVHELAHVRRFDYLVNIFQCLIETLMFYHPVVWWISRCVREEREHCCDDVVVKVCGNRVAYARALATLEGFRAEMPQLAFAATGGSLLNRVRRLLGVPAGEEIMNGRQIGGLALIGIGLLFILAGVYLNLATPMYRATARIKVDRDTSAQLGTENGKVTLTVGDPYFAQTVVEVIHSEVVLRPVVSSLGLSDEWGKRYHLGESSQRTAEVMGLLRARLAVRPVPNSIFFEIGCLSEKPEEARTIANAVAEAYRRHRYQERQETSHVALRTLEDRLKEQEERVHKAQAEVDRLRVELGIPQEVTTENPASATTENAPTFLLTAETFRKLEGVRIELDAQVMREETLLTALKNVSRDKLIYSLPTVAPNSSLNSLLEQKTLTEQAIIIKKKDFGDEHPEVVRLKSQLEDLNTKLNNQVDGILLGLNERLSATKEQLSKLVKEVEIAKQNDIAFAQKSRPYFEAKRNLGEAQRFSQVLAMKIASENIEAALPKNTKVEVMDAAMVPLNPIYPNRAQAAALILFGILLDFGGFRMIRAKPRLTPVSQPG